jgi:CubicO group peptidase (beta-lactamase class C family)
MKEDGVTARSLPTSTPNAQGVDAGAIEAFLDLLEGTSGIEPHSLMVLRHGYVIAAGWWAPYATDQPHAVYSLSKTFTATAAGLAVGEGLVRLDEPVVSYFPEFADEITDSRARAILVRHVAAMASGHRDETWGRAVARDPANPVRGFLLWPPDQDPGSVFAYNQSATYALAAIVQRRTGQTVTQYLYGRLLDRLGAGEIKSEQYPAGQDLGFTGLYATTGTIARLGQLYLQQGAWNGEQLLPPEWVAAATAVQVSTDGMDRSPDWQRGYGYQIWTSRHGYRGDGSAGQFCIVLPDQDAVIAMTAGSTTDGMQATLTAVWDHLLPGFADTPLGAGADCRLQTRLAQLALSTPRAQAAPADALRWASTTFVPAGGACDQQRSLVAVTVGPDQGRWQATLHEVGHDLTVVLGNGSWAVAEPAGAGNDALPYACAGGWLDQNTLRFEIIFLETPHRLAVTCTLPERTFEAQWAPRPPWQAPHMTRPPHLHELRSPVRSDTLTTPA